MTPPLFYDTPALGTYYQLEIRRRLQETRVRSPLSPDSSERTADIGNAVYITVREERRTRCARVKENVIFETMFYFYFDCC